MGDVYADTVAALDELWRRVQRDPRMPTRPAFDCVRAPALDEPSRYPILFFEEGLNSNKYATTSSRYHRVTVRLRFFVKHRNPEEGQADAKDRVLTVVKALTETANDRRLVVNGTALAMNVECPNFQWGAFARDARTSEIIFGGTIDVVVSLHI